MKPYTITVEMDYNVPMTSPEVVVNDLRGIAAFHFIRKAMPLMLLIVRAANPFTVVVTFLKLSA